MPVDVIRVVNLKLYKTTLSSGICYCFKLFWVLHWLLVSQSVSSEKANCLTLESSITKHQIFQIVRLNVNTFISKVKLADNTGHITSQVD